MRKVSVLLVLLTIFSTVMVMPTFAQGVSCPGSLPTQLTVGGRGQVAQTFSTLRDAPAGNPIQVVYSPAQFTVLAGPATDGFLCYFQIKYDNGLTGWADESELSGVYGVNQYYLTPTTDQPPSVPVTTGVSCPGSLATRLVVGGTGSIAQTFSTLRDAPGGAAIETVFAPSTFTVLAGPSTDGFLCYYQIKYDSTGATGWAAESQITSIYGSDLYWLQPTSAG